MLNNTIFHELNNESSFALDFAPELNLSTDPGDKLAESSLIMFKFSFLDTGFNPSNKITFPTPLMLIGADFKLLC